MSRQTRRLFSVSKHDKLVLNYLLLPSWLSGLLVGLASVLIVAVAVSSSVRYYGNSLGGTLQQLFNLYHAGHPPTSVSTTYQTLGNNFSASTLVSDIPLFIFWAGVGLVVYSFAANIFNALQNVADLKAELTYVNADRHELLLAAFEHLAIRLAVLVLWVPFLLLTGHVLLPYTIAVAHAGTGTISSWLAAGYIIWAVFLLALCLHIHTVLLRVLLLKPRVFWQSTYD